MGIHKPPSQIDGTPVSVDGPPVDVSGEIWFTLIADFASSRIWAWSQTSGRVVPMQ